MSLLPTPVLTCCQGCQELEEYIWMVDCEWCRAWLCMPCFLHHRFALECRGLTPP